MFNKKPFYSQKKKIKLNIMYDNNIYNSCIPSL